MKIVFPLLSIFLVSCTLNQANTIAFREPSSTELECQKYYQYPLGRLSSHENKLFKSVIKNNKAVGYQINLERVQSELFALERRYQNELTLSKIGNYDGEDIFRIDIPAWNDGPKNRIIISAGAHGNESAGVATVFSLIEKIIYSPQIRTQFDIVIIPYLNPGGLKNNMRRLNNNIDLNRSFKPGHETGVTKIVQENLKGENFNIALDLHEAPTRNKFFIIKSDIDDNQLTTKVLSKIDQEHLVTSTDGTYPGIMGMSSDPKKKAYDLYGPGEVASSNHGTVKGFYKNKLGVKYSYTLEAPGKFDLNHKIEIYTDIVESYFYEFLKLN